jgi:sialate O-acetylesterase
MQKPMNLRSRLWLTLSALLTVASAHADVQMPSIFGDHMVLQADRKIPFWGTASPNEKISVTAGKISAQTQAGADGKWRVYLDPQSASTTPTTVTVQGQNKLTFQDVLVGEVWLASGQSNMEIGMTKVRNSRDEIAKGDHPMLRLFAIPFTASWTVRDDIPLPIRQEDPQGHWQLCSPEMLQHDGWQGFAGTAYFFGREIQEKTQKPVGLVLCAYLGQPAEAFMSEETLKSDPEFSVYLDKLAQCKAQSEADKAAYPAAMVTYNQAKTAWDAQYGEQRKQDMAAWAKANDEAEKAGTPAPPIPPPPAPEPKSPPEGSARIGVPTTVYNAMIHPVIPYGIRGAIWYQGEANDPHPFDYDKLMAALIKEWRTEWGEGDFPFYFVQLATLGKPSNSSGHGGWPIIREMQFKTQAVPNTGMAVSIDLGDADLHPADKQDVGHRLALLARHRVYGESIPDTGLVYHSMNIEGNKIRLQFDHADGLKLAPHPILADNLHFQPTEVTGFAIAGKDQKWVVAKAEIDGQTVVVHSDQVPEPVAVRYGWASSPMCFLYNGADLPLGPFRTDDWDETPFVKVKY